MANQGRSDFDTRSTQGSAGGNGNGSTEYGTNTGTPRVSMGTRSDDRQGFYSRATTTRNDRQYGYGSEYDTVPNMPAASGGVYSSDFDRARAGMMEDDRAVRSHREEEGRQWRERHPADFNARPPQGWTGPSSDRQNYSGRSMQGYDTSMGPAGSTAYGDYGHPNEEGRQAYGDMGFGGTRETWQRGTVRGIAGTTPGMGMDAGAASHNRRWRRGSQATRDIMTRNPKSARPDDTLQQIAQIMIDEDTGIVPIVEDGNRLVGVVTDRDIVCRLLARGIDLRAAKARDAMTDEVECVTEDTSLHTVLGVMGDHQIRRVPVVARGDRLVGIVSIGDLAREADVNEDLQEAFEEISSHRGFWSRLR